MHTTLFRLTPDAAAKFLSNNKSNRPLLKSTVAMYVADMLSGNWRLTHQGLLVGSNGVLIDGQHRCQAVVKSGVAIDTLISFDETLVGPLDVPVDVGATRERAFVLGITKRETAVAAYIAKRLTGANKISAAALRPYVEFVSEELASLSKTAKRNNSRAPVQAAAVVRMKMRRDDSDYIRSAYAALTLDDFDFMAQAPVVGSFWKQLNDGGMDGYELFTRAFKAFDPANKSKLKLQFHADSKSASDAALGALRTLWDAR